MSKLLLKTYLIVLCIVFLAINFSVSVSADDGNNYYVKFIIPYYDMTNNFDNEKQGFLLDSDKEFVYPNDIKSQAGSGIAIGVISGRLGRELSYLSVDSKGTSNYNGFKADCDIHKINANLKFFLTDSADADFSPYLLVGGSFTEVTFDKAATDSATDEKGNVKFKGYGINLGVGTTVNLSFNFAIDASAVFCRTKINSIRFLGEKADTRRYEVFTNDVVYSIDVIYYF